MIRFVCICVIWVGIGQIYLYSIKPQNTYQIIKYVYLKLFMDVFRIILWDSPGRQRVLMVISFDTSYIIHLF